MKKLLALAFCLALPLLATTSGALAATLPTDWRGQDVVLENTGASDSVHYVGDITYTSNNPDQYARSLTISTGVAYNSVIIIGHDSMGDSAGSNKDLIFSNGLNLTGHLDPAYDPGLGHNIDDYTGWAALIVQNGKTVEFQGDTVMNDYSVLSVNGNPVSPNTTHSTGTFKTAGFTLNGAGAMVEIGKGGSFTASGTASITAGSFTILDGGAATFDKNLLLYGKDASLSMEGSSSLSVGGAVGLGDNAALSVKANATAVIDGGILNETGYVHIGAGATATVSGEVVVASDPDYAAGKGMLVEGDLRAKGLYVVTEDMGTGSTSSGHVTIASGGVVRTDTTEVRGGNLDIYGELAPGVATTGSSLAVSGGEVNVGSATDSGLVSVETVSVSGGRLDVGANGALDVSAVSVAGGAVSIAGSVADNAAFSANGGTVALSGAANAIGGMAGLGSMSISGSAVVTMSTEIKTQSLAMTGGVLNLNTGAVLTVDGGSEAALGGEVNLSGGTAFFNGAVRINSGSLVARTASATIDMGGGVLTVGPTGAIDVQEGSLTLENSGGLDLTGTYRVGHNGTGVTMLNVLGGGSSTIARNATIELNLDARRAFQNNHNAAGMLILDTDGTLTGPGTLVWSSGSTVYTYEIKEKMPATGEWGLYVVDARTIGRDEQYAGILSAWRRNPRVGEHARNVISDSLLAAIVDGSALAEGTVSGFDSLDASGKFNAQALADLHAPSLSGADYDALMLYNGSGLSSAHEAVLTSAGHLMRRVGDRNAIVRREIIRDAPEAPRERRYEDHVVLPGDPHALRIWADGMYAKDKGKKGGGFAGYEYDAGGLMLGVDRRVDDVWLGLALSYLGGDFEDAAAISHSSDIDNYSASLYGGWQSDAGAFLEGTLGYVYTDNALRDYRHLGGLSGWNSGSYSSHTVFAGAALGYDFHLGDYVILSPSAGFNYIHTRNNSHTQSFAADGAPGAETLKAGKVTGYSATIPLNLGLSFDLFGDEDTVFTLSGRLGYAYELSQKGGSGDIRYAGLGAIGPVRIASRERGRHLYNAGVAARYLYRNYEFGASYDFISRDDHKSHALSISAGLNF